MVKILIIEDDILMNQGIAFALEADGYTVLSAARAEEAVKLLSNNPELILLDINLPGMSGMEFCKKIREGRDIPIVFVTARDTEEDTVEAFRSGGDDYITKPFSLPILKERIRAVLKRRAPGNSKQYIHGSLVFDFDKLSLCKDDVEILLTATEVKLLKYFIDNRGKVLTRTQIIERVWDLDGDFVDENALSVNIRRLRAKIEDDPTKPAYIKTIFGIGYIWGDER